MPHLTLTFSDSLDYLDWWNIAICASARSDAAALAGDYELASREGDTAARLYHGFYLGDRG
jgi:hypothetical protein